jgi:hypothetical protein
MRLAFTVVFCLAAVAAVAQEEPERKPDFLFGAPRGYFGIRGGWHAASSSGSIYEFFEEFLTIERSDYDSFVFGAEVGVPIASQVDVVLGLDFSQAKIDSEVRDYVDQEDRPIEQQTSLNIVPLTASLKLYLSERGRSVSTYAYVPAAVRPYVGAGGGVVFYELKQEGEFVDVDDLSIFEDTLISTSAGLGGHVFGGIEARLTPRLSLGFEARYLWSHAGLEGRFAHTEPIDLAGLRITAALNIAF